MMTLLRKISTFWEIGLASSVAFALLVVVIQAASVISTVSSALAQADGVNASDRKRGSVVAVVPRSWPPQYQIDSDGKPFGFAIDVMNEIASRANVSVKYRIAESFSIAVDILRSGGADLIPNSGIVFERLAAFAFTAPVETFVISLFVRKDSEHIDDVEDLVGQNLAVVEKNVGLFMFEKRRDIKVRVFPDVRAALFELIAGHVDALVYPEPVLLALARQIGVEDRIKVVGAPLREIKRGIRVMKANVQLLSVLNKAVVDFVGTPAY